MSATMKQCVPDALAGAPGTSPAGEGADRPTPHLSTVATPGTGRKPRGCVLVWRDGMLSYDARDVQLSVLQLALMTQPASPRA